MICTYQLSIITNQFTYEKPEIIYESEKKLQKKVLNFLDVKITLHEDSSVETDIYYKPTQTHTNQHILTTTYYVIVYTLVILKIIFPTTKPKEL